MSAGALAVLLAGAMVASIELFGPGRGTRLLMQGLTVLILAAALFSIWRRYLPPPPPGR